MSVRWIQQCQIASPVDELEQATSLYFTDRFIFRSNFPGIRLPWECHDQPQETNDATASLFVLIGF